MTEVKCNDKNCRFNSEEKCVLSTAEFTIKELNRPETEEEPEGEVLMDYLVSCDSRRYDDN